MDENQQNSPSESGSRKSSITNPSSDGTVTTATVADELKNGTPVRPGLVKGYGGLIEQSLAAQAANKVKLRPRKPSAALTALLESDQPKKELLLSRRQSGAIDDSAGVMMVDSALMGSWFVACGKNDMESLKSIIAQEPRLARVRQPGSGWTALHWAARHGNIELALLLVNKYEANLNALSRAGYTSLHVAAQHNRPDIMAVLVTECHADRDAVDYSGKTANFYFNSVPRSSTSHSSSYETLHRKPKTLSHAFNASVRRVGSFNSKIRSSMMRRFNTSQGNIKEMKESISSPGPFLPEEGDAFLMPPPLSTIPAAAKKSGRRPGGFAGLKRRGSITSEVSRSDSIISADDVRSLGSARNGKLFDSESDSASFQETGSLDSVAALTDAAFTPPVPAMKVPSGKTASPVVYAKTMTSLDGGSEC
ncbi:putative Ankyrin repeat domain-containing protein SOWAHC [Hypsibius exemplaris]|uniref:Ankyrin repeat domain-containing protein SOWAHC n=1 Tax=Hypsibius exemplaris TaxID=2072580 RepID=A0A1W0X7E9_HYPEX|nr:putative Ankyrin repeat domain-containing protein SOWAHC [Hypsibius exemplaris]